MSDAVSRHPWSEGTSLEGVPYEDQPKIIVDVQCYRQNPDFIDHGIPLPIEHCDITDWMQSNPHEQITILDQIISELDGSTDLDDLGDPNDLDDADSGDHLVGGDGHGMPAGDDGTDIHILSAYVKYLLACRDQNFIPFSDIAGHAQRTEEALKVAMDEAHQDIMTAVDRYSALAIEHFSASHTPLFSDDTTAPEQNLVLATGNTIKEG